MARTSFGKIHYREGHDHTLPHFAGEYGNDVEKQEEVLRENESLGTVMEAMLPKSLGASDSDIQGVIVFMVNSKEMNAGLRPGPPSPSGARPSACIHLLGIHHENYYSLDV